MAHDVLLAFLHEIDGVDPPLFRCRSDQGAEPSECSAIDICLLGVKLFVLAFWNEWRKLKERSWVILLTDPWRRWNDINQSIAFVHFSVWLGGSPNNCL